MGRTELGYAEQGHAEQGRTERYIFLDGMRGVAAFVVVAVHAASIFGIPDLFPSGPLAVDLFFCLSGFVLARAYDAKVQSRGFAWLMRRRILRLYPMIGLAVAFSAALAYAEGKAGVPTLSAAELVLLPVSLITGGVLAFPLNLPMWSLFFEMAGSGGYGMERNRLGIRPLVWIVAASGCVLAGMACFGHIENFGVGGGLSFLAGLPRMVYPFALGMLFARLDPWAPSFRGWKLAVVLVLVFAAPLPAGLICIVVMPALVLLGANATTSALAVWGWLGRISYPLYLLHVPILEAARYFLAGWPLLLVIPLAVASTVAASVAALVFFDEPVRALLGRLRGASVARHTSPTVR